MEELEGVLDDQDIYNLRADTLARWNKFDSFQPEFPRIDPLNKRDQSPIVTGVQNPDPDIASLAENMVWQKVHSDPRVKTPFVQIDTPQSQTLKYMGEKYGFDPSRDNEQFYHENIYLEKGKLGRIWDNTYKGIARFALTTVAKLGQTAGHAGGAIYGILSKPFTDEQS